MRTRVIVGVLVGASTLGILLLDHHRQSFLGLSLLFIVGSTWGMREFLALQAAGGLRFNTEFTCGLTAILCTAQIAEIYQGRHLFPGGIPLPEVLLVLFMVLFMCREVVRGEPERFRNLAVLFLGFFYIYVLGSYSMKIRHLARIGEAAFLWYLVIGKGTDAFAYFTGKALGRHKLIPKVSPGKTIEGSAGGLVLGCAVGVAVWHFTSLRSEIPLAFFIPLTLGVQVVGQFGDLVESLMKRSVQAKDSARLLPGMGGVLDVIDCLLLSAPVAYYGLVACVWLKSRI